MKDAKLAKAFTAALAYMWDGQGERGLGWWRRDKHICDALDQAVTEKKIKQAEAKAAQDLLHARMFPRPNVIEWLVGKGLVTYDSAYKEHERDIQIFRTRWVKELIKEFS